VLGVMERQVCRARHKPPFWPNGNPQRLARPLYRCPKPEESEHRCISVRKTSGSEVTEFDGRNRNVLGIGTL
jgi:hypothetical protein